MKDLLLSICCKYILTLLWWFYKKMHVTYKISLFVEQCFFKFGAEHDMPG